MSIEGSTHLAFSEDVATRFIAYGWNVTRVGDANDLEMLERAFRVFQTTQDRPTLIIVASHIGYGAPHKQDTSAAHSEPLGWAHYTGLKGRVIGMCTFGSSAPLKALQLKFGFTPEKVVSAAKAQLVPQE